MNEFPENDLIVLLNLFPNASWDWDILCQNPCITWKYIAQVSMSKVIKKCHENRVRCSENKYWNSQSSNENIRWTDIVKHQDCPWNFKLLSKNTFNYRKRCKIWQKENDMLKRKQVK